MLATIRTAHWIRAKSLTGKQGQSSQLPLGQGDPAASLQCGDSSLHGVIWS